MSFRNLNKFRLLEAGPNAAWARLWNAFLTDLESRRVDATSPILVQEQGNVTMLSLGRLTSAAFASGAAATPAFPFQIYQFSAGNETTDWRTVRVRQGFGNNLHPQADEAGTVGDDSQADPRNIILPASATAYKIWLRFTIHTDDDPQQGAVDALTIDHSATGWSTGAGDLSNYPNQPDGDPDTGAPPAAFYQLLGEPNTSDDMAKLLTLPHPQPIQTSLQVDMIGWEEFCTNGMKQLRKRLTIKRV